MHVGELQRMGADMRIQGSSSVVRRPDAADAARR